MRMFWLEDDSEVFYVLLEPHGPGEVTVRPWQTPESLNTHNVNSPALREIQTSPDIRRHPSHSYRSHS